MQEDSLFSHVTKIPPDKIFGVQEAFFADSRKGKINLTVGVSVEPDGALPRVWRSVKLAEEAILREEKTKNYLFTDGDADYINETMRFVFGPNSLENIYGAQAVGGTGGIKILADFIRKEISDYILIPSNTWENHLNVLTRAGFRIGEYDYVVGSEGLDFNRMRDSLLMAPARSVILLHPMCHNPTGVDLSMDEWREVSKICHERKLIPFFDSAYQGFGSGVTLDAEPIRLFVQEGHEFFVSHSFSKSTNLYSERVGALFVVMKDKDRLLTIRRNICSIIRTSYSNPPRHGSEIVKRLFQTQELHKIWMEELDDVRRRLRETRQRFASMLEKETGKAWSALSRGNGFFSMLGLSKEQVKILREEDGIYMTERSRINIAAINSTNEKTLVNAIVRVL